MSKDPLEAAALEALRSNQAMLLLVVLTMLEEAADLEDAKHRVLNVINSLTYEQEAQHAGSARMDMR